jgi:hypothetical protein
MPAANVMMIKYPHLKALFIHAIGFLFLLIPGLAQAQGTLPIALTQQFSFTNCATFTNACGTPLQGGLLYFYQVGTVATQQNSFQDTGLTLQNPWPLVLDANGRVPFFYLASGSVHIRLTDSTGVVQFDVPSALVIGPSGGGGGGSGQVDPTTVLATGDIKFRMTQEFVTGWVKLNAQTIGNAVSGATQRANTDTQALFVYLWNNCSSPSSNSATHCPVTGGLGANALADFTAGKQLQLPDWRGRGPMGVDDMGNLAAGRLNTPANITSGGGDTVTTAGASGGEATHTMTTADLVAHSHTNTLSDPGHVHSGGFIAGGLNHGSAAPPADNGFGQPTASATTGITINNASAGSGLPFNQTQPFLLGSWYVKL